MDNQQWKLIEDQLKKLYHPVVLNCDGYRLRLELGRVDTYRNAISMHINGEMDGAWIIDDCQERKRFFRPVHRYVWQPGQRARLKKMSKAHLKRMGTDPDARYTSYWPFWNNFTALRRHLVRNNTTITPIEDQSEAA